LNKVDLVSDRQWFLNEVSRLARNCPVCLCNTIDEEGLTEFYTQALHPGNTHILIGSSGVGKSSILNRLSMDIHLKTSHTSEATNKGRHTTTARELFLLPDGSMLIDTPGMREFGIALDEDITSSGLFPAIDELAVHCRFSDCMHTDEAGCSVLEALQSGTLDPKIYVSYIKLVKEQRHFEIKVEDRKRLGKQFGKILKDYKDFKNRYDY
jgi:ribosome biogenesis GTPase